MTRGFSTALVAPATLAIPGEAAADPQVDREKASCDHRRLQ